MIMKATHMKKFFPVILFAIFATLAGCCTSSNVKHPEARPTFVDEIKSDTVALTIKDEDGDTFTFCTGVWIGKNKILTADHCAKAVVYKMLEELLTGEEDEDEVEKIVDSLEDGIAIEYVVHGESGGAFREPKRTHTAVVLRHDTEHDLALLVVKDQRDTPAHHVARIASVSPPVGDTVHVMGHVTGLTWTYTKTMVSAYREVKFKPVYDYNRYGPWMQLAGEVYKGNSGGGGFNDAGELVGIASFIMRAPNESFFVHVSTIREFVGLAH